MSALEIEPYYRVDDACKLADCTQRQFYYWIAKGWLPPTWGDGTARLTVAHVRTLRDFALLMKCPKGALANEVLTLRRAQQKAKKK